MLDYATTKAGIVARPKEPANQLLGKGIRANVVAPGIFRTPLQSSGGQLPEAVMKFGSESPHGRPSQPVEIASVYVLFASQEWSPINGEVFGATSRTSVA